MNTALWAVMHANNCETVVELGLHALDGFCVRVLASLAGINVTGSAHESNNSPKIEAVALACMPYIVKIGQHACKEHPLCQALIKIGSVSILDMALFLEQLICPDAGIVPEETFD